VTTKALISKTLEYAISPAVRTQDVAVLLVRLAKQGGLGFNMTWQFVIDRADDILKKFGGELFCCWQVQEQLLLRPSYSWLRLARRIVGCGKSLCCLGAFHMCPACVVQQPQ
jgi:hypothetical protein